MADKIEIREVEDGDVAVLVRTLYVGFLRLRGSTPEKTRYGEDKLRIKAGEIR